MRLLPRQQTNPRRTTKRRGNKVIRKIGSLVLDASLDMWHIRWRIHRQILIVCHYIDEVRLLLGLASTGGDGLSSGDQAHGQNIGDLHVVYCMERS